MEALVTLMGAWLSGGERAFAWADSETADRDTGVTIEYAEKLIVNRHSKVVGMHAGDRGGAAVLSSAIACGASFDEMLIGLPAMVRDKVDDRREVGMLESVKWWVFGIVGWSQRFRMMMVAQLEAHDEFTPRLIPTGFAVPHLDEFRSLHPGEPADIVGLAQGQMRNLKNDFPRLSGDGWVDIADIRRDVITVARFDLASGRQEGLASFAEGMRPCDPWAKRHGVGGEWH
jgi:hypothetical protein